MDQGSERWSGCADEDWKRANKAAVCLMLSRSEDFIGFRLLFVRAVGLLERGHTAYGWSHGQRIKLKPEILVRREWPKEKVESLLRAYHEYAAADGGIQWEFAIPDLVLLGDEEAIDKALAVAEAEVRCHGQGIPTSFLSWPSGCTKMRDSDRNNACFLRDRRT
jgi:hypothetical protein